MDRLNHSTQRGRPVSSINAAKATDAFEHFISAGTLKTILFNYQNLCEFLHLKPNVFPLFYPKLKSNLNSWKAKALWKKFDSRLGHKCYARGKACPNTRVLIIGAGPCGLRTAIEAQLLGAKVVVIEKRDRMSRNNVLHLWPFVIEDLRNLGAKKFFGKFCAGAIDHISIRQLQCILFKVALLLGVEIHTEVSFEQLIEPSSSEKIGWRAEFKPADHPVSQYEFDVIIGADGKRNTLQGFKRKEFRGKLAIAITANFINKRTEAEARVEEISGVAFIFNQKFFKELNATTGIDLENIVYYKDDTHYFVMTAKKHSLIDKGVIMQDFADTARLLSPDNVDREALLSYAREAADFSTNYQMPDLEFAVNHYGQPDVAMFDFTSMYAAENASKFVERNGYKLLTILVGDSLLEPFWPTGSGCARGFLSALDASWAIKAWGSGSVTPLEVLAERESIYRLLAQTTPENLNKDCKSYALDPSTRYPNLNKALLLPQQVLSLYDTDDPSGIELTSRTPLPTSNSFEHRKRRRRDIHLDPNTLLNWIKDQVKDYADLNVEDVTTSFRDGRVLCAIIHHYRPDLLDYSAIKAEEVAKNNQLAFDLLEKEIGIPPVLTGEDMANSEVPDYLTMFSYLTQIYDSFRGEIPHIKHLKLNFSPKAESPSLITNFQTMIPSSNNENKDSKMKLNAKISSNLAKIAATSSTDNKSKPKKRIKSKAKRSRSKMSNFLCMPPTVEFKSLSLKNKFEVYKVVFLKEDADLIASPEIKESDDENTGTADTEELVLNFNPIKSLEEYENNKTLSEFNENETKFEGINILDYSRGDYICERSIKSSDYEKSELYSSQLSLQYFDENFKEIKSREFLESCLTFLENSKGEKSVLNKSINSSISDDQPSHIIVRCVEEGIESVSLRELRFCTCSNTIVIDKPVKQQKCRVNLNKNLHYFENQACTPLKTKLTQRCHKNVPQLLDVNKFKFLFLSNMSTTTANVEPELTYDRIVDWINLSDFKKNREADEDLLDRLTDITSVTEALLHNCHNKAIGDIVIPKTLNKEEQLECDQAKANAEELNSNSLDNMKLLLRKLKTDFVDRYSQDDLQKYPLKKLENSKEPSRFSVIRENDETDLSECKEIVQEKEIKAIKVYSNESTSAVINRNSNSLRSKRHLDNMSASTNQSLTSERKNKKRKSKYEAGMEERRKRLEEIAANRTDRQNKRRDQRRKQTDQFIKSMQMLHTNDKSESGPFEDYSLFVYRQTAPQFQDRVKNLEKKFTYVPDRENRLPNQGRGAGGSGGADEEFAARIKDLEDKWREPYPSAEKKPKGLMRAIGKIETSDWNIKEIEKKILQNKLGKSVNKEKERVPKWNREQFLARQTKLEKLDRQSSTEGKYSELDKGIKRLEQKLKEGSVRDLGQNKVATITEKLVPKTADPEIKPVLVKTTVKPNVILPTPNVSEYCHFCQKRVYLMERLSAEGRFFHRGCFKCQYCHVVLRLGSYLFDREGMYGYKFYCTQHFGMVGEIENKTAKKLLEKLKESEKPLDKLKITPLIGFDGVDLLNRVQTPERIEFANLSAGHISSDHDESLSQMDEDEWTDRNFGASTGEICSSEDEDESTSLSGTESDNEDAFEEALEEPPTKEGTMRWMERYKQRYSKQHARDDDSESDDYSSSSDHSSYYENSTGDDEDGPVTEDEEEIRARELRKQEVRVEPPVIQTDTGSETEIVSDETTSSSSKHNSATEISTDSEFAVDDPTPTREIPSITFNDYNVTKTRGNYGPPKRVQVKSGILQTPINGKSRNSGIKLEFTPLIHSPIILSKPPAPISLLTRTDGYALNRTQSTGGIATKVSLELKKKYLLGDPGIAGNIQKSGSVSALDSKFKSFHTNITDCQKLLKPSLDTTPTPQSTCTKSPLSPVVSQSLPLSDQSSKSHDAVSPNVQSVKQKEVVAIIDLTSSPNQNNTQEGNEQPTSQPEVRDTFKHELEGRPRSPVEEIPIVVPTIDWSQVPKLKDNGISSDSLTSDTESEEHSEIHQLTSNVSSNNIPRVQVHNDAGEVLHSWDNNIPLDSLNPVASKLESEGVTLDDSIKSIINDKKVLNQPKLLPELQKVHVHKDPNFIESGHSTPSEQDSFMDLTNAALTETELSDWARDGMVSDDFEDVEYELNPRFVNSRKNKQPKGIPKSINKCVSKAKMEEFDDVKHVCGKEKQKSSLAENLNNLLSSLEFMDTGEETSSDEKVLEEANLKNNGYVEFQNEDEIIEDSLNPCINAIIETVNPEIRKRIDFDDLSSCDKNTGYCIIGNDDYSFGGQVIDLKKDDIQKMKEKQIICDNEEDSLLILETGTTTEENTFSDSTVKNLIETGESEKKDSCDVITSVVKDTKTFAERIKEEFKPVKEKDVINEDYQEHCQRLQSKVEFGNAKDSIDIRKSKRKEKVDFPLKPDLIQEEGPNSLNNKESLDDLLLVTPKIIYTKEQVQKVRDENQRLVQEMVMNKMKAQNRSLERKKRNRNSFSPNRSFDLKKSATTDITTAILNNENDNKRMSTYSTTSSVYSSPDIIKPLKSIEQKQILNITELNKNNENRFDNGNRDIYLSHVSSIKQHPKSFAKQLSVHSSFQVKSTNKPSLCSDLVKANSETSSLPDIQQALQDEFKTPTAPPRHKNFDIQKSTEKLKQDARARVRLKSNEDLGLSPEEKLKKLREKINRRGKENDHVDVHIQDSIESLVINTDKRNSLLYSNDTLKKKRNNSFHRSKSGENVLHSKTNSVNLDLKELYPVRTKSVSELPNSLTVADESLHSKDETRSKLQFCKSDPNLLTDNYGSPDMKIKKGGIERRKSISKFISDLFGKKREGGLSSKGFLSRISPKAKSKSMSNLSGNNADKAKEEITRTNSLSRISTQYRQVENASPPPIPPLPLNYTGTGLPHFNDDSTDGENDWKRHERSSCDTLDKSDVHRRSGKGSRRGSRQAQLKRHRMAQEIQRKLEETEVKTRELEQRGVTVEKALRGEISDAQTSKEECDLLKQWFDLMRELTELRRYEKELTVRADELELEDRHTRLQQQLRERLDNDGHKTKADVKVESNIISEMMDIVAKRDSLITVLEQDRIRYSEEDRDFEEQMLAKGLRLTPLQKSSNK